MQPWLNTVYMTVKIFFSLFSNKMFIIRTEIHKMLVRITNREDLDQTVSSDAVCSESMLFVWAFKTRN